MSGRFLFTAVGGFAAGVLLRSFFDLGVSFVVFTFVLTGALIAHYFLSGKRAAVLIIALAIFSVGVGAARAQSVYGAPVPELPTGKQMTFEGVVAGESVIGENNQRFILRTTDAVKVLIVADLHPRLQYGDTVSVVGTIEEPENFKTETGRVFDYKGYLAKDDIYYRVLYPDIRVLAVGGGNPLRRVLFSVKEKFLATVARIIPEPHVSLLGGLVVGADESLGDKWEEDFRKTGIIHIVVLSGYNVTIVAEAIMRVFSFLPILFKTSFGVVAIVFFALATGASATTVRASIMALLVILARATGRTYDITRALLIAGFLMLLHNPRILVFDSSFQLSFAATVGLIYLAPLVERRLGFVPSRLQLREFATATVATQLFVLPLLLVKTGELSLVALPVNLLVLGVVPMTMLVGFLTGVLGFVHTFIALPFGFVAYVLLTYILKTVETFAALPFASVSVAFFPVWLAIIIYAVYATLFFVVRKAKCEAEASH